MTVCKTLIKIWLGRCGLAKTRKWKGFIMNAAEYPQIGTSVSYLRADDDGQVHQGNGIVHKQPYLIQIKRVKFCALWF